MTYIEATLNHTLESLSKNICTNSAIGQYFSLQRPFVSSAGSNYKDPHLDAVEISFKNQNIKTIVCNINLRTEQKGNPTFPCLRHLPAENKINKNYRFYNKIDV